MISTADSYFEPLVQRAVVARKVCASQLTASNATVQSLTVANITTSSVDQLIHLRGSMQLSGVAAVGRRLQVGSNVTPATADIWGPLNVKTPVLGVEANIVLDGELQAGSIRATKVSASGNITASNLITTGGNVVSTDLQTRIYGNPATGRVSFTTTNTALGAVAVSSLDYVDLAFAPALSSNNYSVSLTSVVTRASDDTPIWGVSNISANGFAVNTMNQVLIDPPFGFTYLVSRWA